MTGSGERDTRVHREMFGSNDKLSREITDLMNLVQILVLTYTIMAALLPRVQRQVEPAKR
jgi:hypothetical protein